MTTVEEHKSGGMGRDVIIYVCLLVLAAIQFVIAYQNIDASRMLVRMLAVAIVEAGLALPDFHHSRDSRNAIWVDRQLPSAGWSTMGEVGA